MQFPSTALSVGIVGTTFLPRQPDVTVQGLQPEQKGQRLDF